MNIFFCHSSIYILFKLWRGHLRLNPIQTFPIKPDFSSNASKREIGISAIHKLFTGSKIWKSKNFHDGNAVKYIVQKYFLVYKVYSYFLQPSYFLFSLLFLIFILIWYQVHVQRFNLTWKTRRHVGKISFV